MFFRKYCFQFVLACGLLIAGCQTASADDTTIEMRAIQPGVWVHTSYNTFEGVRYPSNGLIVREGDHLVLLDPAWGAAATRVLLARIRGEIGLPVTRALASHFHGDRTDGVNELKAAGIEVWTHPMTQTLSAKEGNPVPEHALSGLNQPGDTVSFGSMEVLYPGAGHAPDNLMVWLPEQHLLYGGCAVRELATDNLGNTGDADLASWSAAIRRAQHHYPDARVVVPGHGAIGGPDLLSHMHELFEAAE